MKYTKLFTFFFTLLLVSCDYYFGYDFDVINTTANDIKVQTFLLNEGSFMEIEDEFVILPNRKATVFIRNGGNCSKDCPVNPLEIDSLNQLRRIDSISITIEESQVDFNYLNVLSNWTFTSHPQVGVYEIEIIESDFD
ncbi:hypothetical protein [Psychroserpens sp. MEBiC05023]